MSLFSKKKVEVVTGPGSGHPYRELTVTRQPEHVKEDVYPKVIVADQTRRLIRTKTAILVEELVSQTDSMGQTSKFWKQVYSGSTLAEAQKLSFTDHMRMPIELVNWLVEQIQYLTGRE